MSLVKNSVKGFTREIADAEIALNSALDGGDEGFSEGVVGGHEDFWSWFSSGLTGAAISKGMDDEGERALYIKRNAAEFEMAKLNDTIEKARVLRGLRAFTEEEAQNVLDVIERRDDINAALGTAYDLHGGDLDAPIYESGDSFNDKWGMGDGDAGLVEFMVGIMKNPTYGAGMLVGEMLKDAPLSVLAYLGMAAKGVSGASVMTKVINKLNGIQSKALRGLSKVATPVGVGAVAGGSYEMAYSKFNEGKVKWDDVQAGTEFGAAFGILGAIGVFGKGLPQVKDKTDTSKPATPTEDISNKDIDNILNTLKDEEGEARLNTFNKTLFDEHATRIFPELTHKDYQTMSRKEAIKAGILKRGEKEGKGALTRTDAQGNAVIIWDNKATKATHKRLIKNFSHHLSEAGTLATATAKEVEMLRNPLAYKNFQLAHEKAHVLQNKQGKQYEAHPNDADFGGKAGAYNKELEANQMALKEMNRVWVEYKKLEADTSAMAAAAQAQAEHEALLAQQDAAKFLPKNYEDDMAALKQAELLEGVEPNSKVMNYLNKHKAISTAAAVAGTYAAVNEEDALYAAGGAAIAVLGGPKLYNHILSRNLPQEIAKAKLQAAKAHEGLSNYTKGLNVVGQDLGDIISATFPHRGPEFLNAVEYDNIAPKTKKKILTDEVELKILKRWKEWTKFLGGQGKLVGLFEGPNGTSQLLMNFAPHVIKGKINKDGKTVPLTVKELEDLTEEMAANIDIKGSTNTAHSIPRKLVGSIEDLKAKGYDVLDDPAQILAIYTQSLTRAIHNRKLLHEVKQIDLGNRERPMPALFSVDEFDKFVKADRLTVKEQLLYTEFDHPALKGYKVHNNIKQVLNHHFVVRREGGLWGFADGLLTLNNSLKRIFVFGSLFHASALFMSGVYAFGATGAIKGLLGKGKMNANHDWQEFALGTTEFREASHEAMRAGLMIVNTRDRSLVNVGKDELDNVMDQMAGFGRLSRKAFDGIDTVTWEYMHDRYKLAAYLRHKEVLMTKHNIDDVASSRMAAEFTNDAFGSLDWNRFATHLHDYAYRNPGTLRAKGADTLANLMPEGNRRFLNLGLFAPDWTISNIRIVGKTFWNAPKMTKLYATNMYNKMKDPNAKFTKDEHEFLKSWNMYAAYAGRAGVYTSAMWWAFTEMFSDEEPTMDSFIEFWVGETSGKLQLGNGESMVISKQIAEPIHWVQHPQHTLLNKMSVVPKTVMEGFFNKQWFSMKKGFPMGPPLVDDDGTTHYGKWGLGKLFPIVVKPALDDSLKWQEQLQRIGTGFIGLPQYGSPDDD